MKNLLILSALLFAASSGTAQALEPFVLYDDFSLPTIVKTKWSAAEGPTPFGLDAVREIQDGALRFRNRSLGASNAGNTGVTSHFVTLALPNPAVVDSMKARVTVSALSVNGCPQNTSPTLATAGLIGSFFNTGDRTEGSPKNDVIVSLVIFTASSDPPGTLHVGGIVLKCLDDVCGSTEKIGSPDLGTIATGAFAKLALRWDKDNDQFIFTRDGTITDNISYSGHSDSNPPGLAYKTLQAENLVANCEGVKKTADMSALFDNVFLNASAVGAQ